MKQFLKPLSHCLTTAVITSALLEIYLLPPVAASIPETPQPAPAENALPTAEPAISTPEPLAISEPEVQVPVAPSPAPAPAASPAAPQANAAPKPAPSPEPAKATPAAAQKPAETGSVRTVAGMRQTLEKRLAELAEQNKDQRNAQWQENLSQTAIQAAWNGHFDQARQIARHPALPSAIQLDLLNKIATIEVQWQTVQLAQQLKPGQKNPQTAAKPGAPTATNPGGRAVPSGSYAGVAPNWVGSLGVSPANQCLALQAPTAAAKPAQTAAQPAPTAQAKTPKGSIPAFVPALGQNLAARLAQVRPNPVRPNQTKPNQTAAQPATGKPLVSPSLFTGVAAGSFRVATSTPPRTVTSPAQVMTEIPAPAVARPAMTAAQTAPVETVAALPQLPPVQAGSATEPADANPTVLTEPLEQAEATLTNVLPYPFNLAWDWWTPDSAQNQQTPEATAYSDSASFLDSLSAPTIAFVGAAQLGLNNNLLFQTWSQDLTAALQPARSAFKLSIPSLAVAKTVNPKTQAVAYDTAALLAMSCSNAQLASQLTSYVVDPATSKKMGWVNLMFPLPIPAVVTSLFGWRIHPISGNLSFHTGLDLGAPMGTPVLAAQPGRVVAADDMGGYGLAVVVENPSTRERNLYGHLSGIAVQPGAQVNQGTVLGWVGSTGNSTGPHLHFETMVHTESGWTAIDPLASAAVAVASNSQPASTR